MRKPEQDAPPHAVGLGEALLRLSAPNHERFGQSPRLDAHVGGAEINVLIALSSFGVHARWLTRMADNALGRTIVDHAVGHGLDARVDWDSGARTPLYFVEHGVPPRATEVVYDRSDSGMTRLAEGSFCWAKEVDDAKIALTSGITCALGPGPTRAVQEFLEAATRAGADTAFDVNHRARLWTWEDAAPVLRGVLPSVRVLAASHHDLQRLLPGTSARDDAVHLARRAIEAWGHRVVLLRENAHPGLGLVTVRATAVTANDVIRSTDQTAQVIDPFGAGDASLGAFLAVWMIDGNLQAAVDVAAWAAAFQHTVVGDAWQGRPFDVHSRLETRKVLR